MTTPEMPRRRFLALLAGVVGAGVTAGWAWLGWGSRGDPTTPDVAGAPLPGTSSSSTTRVGRSTTSGPPPTTGPPATTGSIAPGSTTTAPSTTATTAAPATSIPPTTSPPTTTSLPATTTTIATTGAATIQALCKAAWGGRPAAGSFTDHTIARMTVHHTAALLDRNSSAPARVRQHQRFHIDDRGWADLAYHFIVDANGHVYEGRPVSAVGDTGTNYDPTGHFLVCAEGDFNRQSIPTAQVAAVTDVLAWGAATFGVDASTIRGHRDWAATSCPGDGFYPLISEGTLEQAVRDRVVSGAPDLTVLCGDVAAQQVADIEAGLI